MEYLTNTITDIVIIDDNIIITYDNNMTETIAKSYDDYMKMYETWLKNEPMFISDKYKTIIYALTLIKIYINNINILNDFFIQNNIENVKKFFIYMRGRKEYLVNEKLKWNSK